MQRWSQQRWLGQRWWRPGHEARRTLLAAGMFATSLALATAQSDGPLLAVAAAGPAQAAPPMEPAPFDATPLRSWQGQNIVLRTDAGEAYAVALLQKLDSFVSQSNRELAALLDVPVRPLTATIVVFETQDRYQRHARHNAPGLINNGGYYDGGTRTVVTYRYNNSMQLFFHELVHALMAEHFEDHHFHRYTRKNWPIWFDEGVSEYLGSYAVDGEGIRVPAPNKGKLAYVANALGQRAFVPLASLLRAPAASFSGASMNIYYAESWALVDYLARHPVYRSQVPLFFRRIRAGEDGLAAFAACFAEDLNAFEQSWRTHIRAAVEAPRQPVWLFRGHSIDDWTIHEGGRWQVERGEIVARGERHYNYLIKSELPVRDFRFELDLMLERGTAGLILGNNYHGEYPYYYLIDVARDAVMLRRSYTATRIDPVKQAFAEIAPGRWVHVEVTVVERSVRVAIDGREVLQAVGDRDSYSLFGLYLYHASARFKNIRLLREPGDEPGWARGQAPAVLPGGAGGPAESPRVGAPLRPVGPNE